MQVNNKLSDLNNHLFAELERLSDEELVGDKLNEEIQRAQAVCEVSTQIIANGTLALKAEQFKDNAMSANVKIPKFLSGGVYE